MRILTSKGGDLSTYFDINNENKLNNTTLKKALNGNHTTQANHGKVFSQLALEVMFGFCTTFEKVTKSLGFHIT